MSTPRPRSASSSGAIGRARACSSPSNSTDRGAQRGQRRHEPQHRAGQPAVDAGAAASGASAPPTVRSAPLAVDVEAEGPQRADHQVGVAAAQRADDRRARPAPGRRPARRGSARGWSATSSPGTVTVACTGVGALRCRPQLGAHGSILPCRALLPPWRHVRTIRGHHRPGPAGREDPRHRRGDRRGGGDSRAQLQRRPDGDHRHRGRAATTNPTTPRRAGCG